ncbi:hypothetical protein EOE67_19280 [Rheinheimera riviphila]|uniref:Uncharacterized protein n=1 Tax=Rheinheimera riviphila TaxID=1834037 RepID=A0A437QBR8_9GAMM|nr:hypothetical protein [Rheinheimera riviphila]RVU32000.1 hypothetical protein EOE67_19280 [Rheinheimera riviphila]
MTKQATVQAAKVKRFQILKQLFNTMQLTKSNLMAQVTKCYLRYGFAADFFLLQVVRKQAHAGLLVPNFAKN